MSLFFQQINLSLVRPLELSWYGPVTMNCLAIAYLPASNSESNSLSYSLLNHSSQSVIVEFHLDLSARKLILFIRIFCSKLLSLSRHLSLNLDETWHSYLQITWRQLHKSMVWIGMFMMWTPTLLKLGWYSWFRRNCECVLSSKTRHSNNWHVIWKLSYDRGYDLNVGTFS